MAGAVLFQNGSGAVACRVGRFADGRLYCVVPDELDELDDSDELARALGYTPDEWFDFRLEDAVDEATGRPCRIFFRKRPRTLAANEREES